MIKQPDYKFLKLNFLESSLVQYALIFLYAFQIDNQIKLLKHLNVEQDDKNFQFIRYILAQAI